MKLRSLLFTFGLILFAVLPSHAQTLATAYTVTGPSSGTTGVTSTNFTVTPNGYLVALDNLVVTPADGGAGGTFTPTTLTFTPNGTTTPSAQTFTYTPSSVGAKTLSFTHTYSGTPSISDPGNLTYTVSGPVLTITSASLASDGRTLTVNVGGVVTTPLKAASGLLTGFTVTDAGVVVPAKATPNTSTVTLFLSYQAIPADTVIVNYAPGNLNDSAATANTMPAQGPVTVTNNSSASPPNLTQIAAANFSSVPGLQCWLKAGTGVYKDLGTTPATADGDLIEQWNDQSGNGFNATQVTSGSRPALRLGINGLNGFTGLQFTSKNMALPAGIISSTFDQSMTVFVVERMLGTGAPAVVLGTGAGNWFTGTNGGSATLCNPPVNFSVSNTAGTMSTTWSNLTITSGTGGSVGFPIHVLDASYDGAHVSAGCNDLSTVFGNSGGNNIASGNIALSGTMTIGGLGGSNPCNSVITDVLVCNQALPLSLRQAIEAGLYAKDNIQLENVFVFEGDSLTSGFNSTSGHNYPTQMMALYPLGTGNYWWNFGVFGETVATMLTNAPTKTIPISLPLRPMNPLILWGGTNDISTGTSAATTYGYITSYVALAKAAGYQVFVGTMLPRTDGFETQRQAYNTLIRNGAAANGYTVIDLGNDPTIGQPGACTNLMYFSADGVHLTDQGYEIVARVVKSAVDSYYAYLPTRGRFVH